MTQETQNIAPVVTPIRSRPPVLSKNARAAMRWLRDMALFYEELQTFVGMLPDDIHPSETTRVPWALQHDERFQNLFRMSQSGAYMTNIPFAECRVAIEMVHDLAKDTFLMVCQHPAYRSFEAMRQYPPFFESTMMYGASLGVEHTVDMGPKMRASRKCSRRNITKSCANGKKKPVHHEGNTASDDEIGNICKAFGLTEDKTVVDPCA